MGIRKTMWVGAAAALVMTVACKEPLDVGAFSVDGQWKGRLAIPVGTDSARYTFVLDLDQSAEDVSGSATIQSGAETVDADVVGSWDYPTVRLRLTAPGFDVLDYTGTFATRDTLKGPLVGSGFTSATLSIVRQP
jgi:hypothetical protein